MTRLTTGLRKRERFRIDITMTSSLETRSSQMERQRGPILTSPDEPHFARLGNGDINNMDPGPWEYLSRRVRPAGHGQGKCGT